jgi:hypothetical protein
MKKPIIWLLIAFVCLFFASCAYDTIHYCPYCKSMNIKEVSAGVYQCNNEPCGKKFGAMGLSVIDLGE